MARRRLCRERPDVVPLSWGEDDHILLGGFGSPASLRGRRPTSRDRESRHRQWGGRVVTPQLLPRRHTYSRQRAYSQGNLRPPCRSPSTSGPGRRRSCWDGGGDAGSLRRVRIPASATWYTPSTGRCLRPPSTRPRFRWDRWRRLWRGCGFCRAYPRWSLAFGYVAYSRGGNTTPGALVHSGVGRP